MNICPRVHFLLTNLIIITHSKKPRDNCFLYTAPKLWNNLPNNITSQCNVNSFITYLFKYVLPATVYSLYFLAC